MTIAIFQSYCKGVSVGLNEDTLGGIIKCAVAQYLALEITRGNGKDNRAVIRYFPWLYNTASLQQTYVQQVYEATSLGSIEVTTARYTKINGRNLSTSLNPTEVASYTHITEQ